MTTGTEILLKHMLRAMAWERAKGELVSMLQTFKGEEQKYRAMEDALRNFITKIENEELHACTS